MKVLKSTIAEIAMQTAIMDAMEKGHTNAAELSEYVKSETFIAATKNYIALFESEFC